MKQFTPIVSGQLDTLGVITQVLTRPPQGALFAEVRQRNKVLDVIEKGGAVIQIEDAQHEQLKGWLENFPFGRSDRDLEAVLTPVIEAATVPPPEPKPA